MYRPNNANTGQFVRRHLIYDGLLDRNDATTYDSRVEALYQIATLPPKQLQSESLTINNKLQQAELKNGQKAALVIRLYYEEERQKAEGRRAINQFGNTDVPDLEQPSEGSTYSIRK